MSRILILSVVSLGVAGAALAQGAGDYPPDAEPGSCYARVLIPETYEIQTEQVLDQPEHTEARVIPATYETVVERDAFLGALVHGDWLERNAPPGLREIRDIAFSGNGEPTSASVV